VARLAAQTLTNRGKSAWGNASAGRWARRCFWCSPVPGHAAL